MSMYDGIKTVIIGGFGGCLPTLCGLASTAVAQPTTPVFSMSILQGLLVYFLIGAVVAYAMVADKNDARAILFAGVTAPAIIAGINSGQIKDVNTASQTPISVQTTSNSTTNP